MQTTRIDIIRHGEPQGGNVFRGHTDHELTVLGQWQFQQRLHLHQQAWQQIYSSPLKRCAVSAQQLAQQLALPLMFDDRLREIHYGDWENQDVNHILKAQAQTAKTLWDDPLNFCAPNGESVLALQQRVVACWNDIIEHHQGEHILVVCHGGVMRLLAQHLLMLDPKAMNRLAIPYAGLMQFKIVRSEYQDNVQDWVTLESMDGSELNNAELEEDTTPLSQQQTGAQ